MWTLLTLSLLAGAPAEAGKVYINDVRADSLRNTQLKGVDVTIDENGDVRIIAPQYNIEVVGGSGEEDAEADSGERGVEKGVWWLVTEDNSSSGHAVDVYIDGAKIKTVKSGGAQVILDLGPYLRRGANKVSFISKGGAVDGGVLKIYIGRATNQSGTLQMDTPQVEYSRRATDGGEDLKDFELKID